jgi:hypothetical protein
MGNKLVNAPNIDATQRGKANEQHKKRIKLVVQRDLVAFSTTHQATPQTSTHPHVVM